MHNPIIFKKPTLMKKMFMTAGIALFAVIAVFASTGVGHAAEVQAVDAQAPAGDALLQKQSEIDAYVFETHADEMAGQDIHVMTTGVIGDVVEVSILDYTDEKAEYLYEIFGNEQVKVVEGEQMVLFDAPADAAPDLPMDATPETTMTTTSAPITTTAADISVTADDASTSSNAYLPWIIGLAVVALGAIALFSRKLRSSQK